MSQHAVFGAIYALILVTVTLLGIEAIASFHSPAWPARALRSTEPVNWLAADAGSFADKPWMVEPFNSWGMRDRERSVAKPAGVGFRSVFIGDSFLEALPTSRSLPAAVEQRFAAVGRTDTEAINLGVSGTSPPSYYYRLRDVALKLSPDALAVFFFSGNDFLREGEGYGDGLLPPLVSESPGRSLIGSVMPRTNWLAVNRFRQSEFLKGNKSIPREVETLQAIVRGPPDRRVPLLAQHLRRHYFPDLPEAQLVEILSRGGDAFWDAFAARPRDEEFLMGWIAALMVRTDLNDNAFSSVRTREQAAAFALDADIAATLSWLVAMDDLARARGVPLRLFLIPAASVDPAFAEFWKPWPRYYSWYLHCAARHERLVAALRGTAVSFVDLQPAFQGVPDTYRKADGHWNERGLDIAADQVFRELLRLDKAGGKSSAGL
ncbi:SGNH/GDSL hydrolase family protein [Reyranella sp.]|uniref:SGNH/GDSL hydrolase family protein n=1 Tax=Reyranella sp. TaxID=1929291 RepID=UPI00272F8FB3|nr:SGNH/GDSL hydrolase family protein [Reyranella sp.]MDP2376750.1 SGNH/GDSL hydrolase family protein [Reyranella sp.]